MNNLRLFCLGTALVFGFDNSAQTIRALRFEAESPAAAVQWQTNARAKLFSSLMGGSKPVKAALKPELLRRIETEGEPVILEEWKAQSLPDRTVHFWIATPKIRPAKLPAILALHGHGGTGEQIVRGQSLYWYGKKLAEMGWFVISPDIGQHELQNPSWSLMGERVWDALRCLDYLESRPEADLTRLAVAGLSLGGETAMYVAALDERIRAACSSGWLTTVENMKTGHCPCWNFPGLEQQFDFSDIFACVAPRPLILELGEKERAPGGFPVEIGRKAFAEIQKAYRVFGAEQKVQLEIHSSGHVFSGKTFFQLLQN